MQPRKLTMRNFGPFIAETLDFSNLQASGLFLISGKTGAGKTTIFDGMTYALFGETSGSLRIGKEMRSMFASPTEATEVSFTFEHQGLLYQIQRRPDQILAKKRGSGTTEHKSKVILSVFDEHGEKKRELTKKNEVDQFIKDLLQLDAKQFFQIIMLPQGEFRNFLVASSNDKEKVLRNLFGTQLYQRLNEWLKEKNKAQQKQLDAQLLQAELLTSRYLWSDTEKSGDSLPETLELWRADLKAQKTKIAQLTEQLVAEKKAKETAEKAYYAGQNLQAAFAEKETLETELAQRQQKQAEIKRLRQEVAKRSWLQAQLPKYQHYQQSQQASQQNQQELTQVQQEILQAEQAYANWQAKREEIAERQLEMTELTRQKNQLEQLLPLAKELQTLETISQQKNAELVELKSQQTELLDQQTVLTEKIQQMEAFLTAEKSWQEAKLTLVQGEHLAENWQKLHQQLSAAKKTEQELNEQLAEKQQLERQTEKYCTDLQAKLKQAKSENAKLLIARLSLDLLPGEPCPVCGALEHPKQATHQQITSGEIQTSEQLVETTEVELQQSQADQSRLVEQAAQLVLALKEAVRRQEQLIQEMTVTTAAFDKLYPSLNEETEPISPPVLIAQEKTRQKQQGAAFQQAATRLAESRSAQEGLTTQLQHVHEQLQQRQNQLLTLAGQKESLQKQLTDRQVSELTATLANLEKQLAKSAEILEADRLQREQLKDQQLTLTERNNYLQMQQTRLTKQFTQAEAEFLQTLATAPFEVTVTLFGELATADLTIEQLQDEIKTFDERQLVIQQRLAVLAERLAEAKQPDLAQLAENHQRSQQRIEEHQAVVTELKERQQQNEKLAQELQTLYQKNQQQLEQQLLLQQLTETINGDNPYRLSLERYVLQLYLAEILTVANQRLAVLTKGRYQFELADQVNSNKKNTGLEINIYDDNAGAARRAHTLSGGESFIAALALALSLADVIQNRAGGIALEALFIDEGFGSLDEEALAMALEALKMVESEGRMIGIISHVRELKEEIPQQILVQTNGAGQSKIINLA